MALPFSTQQSNREEKNIGKVSSRKKILISTYLLLNAIILKELEWNNQCVFRSQGMKLSGTNFHEADFSVPVKLNLQRMLSRDIGEKRVSVNLHTMQ